MNNTHNHLVVLSVPFVRLIRVLLSPEVRNTLLKHSNVLVVSPFSDNKTFQEEFTSNQIEFFLLNPPERFSNPFKALYTISEILRMHGFWIRYRKHGLAYYVTNRFITMLPNGNDSMLSPIKKFFFGFLGLIGICRKSWRFIDCMIGASIFENFRLTEITHGYKKVTLIQSASWGIQDRILGWMARKHKWRKVLIPYTTDQLFCNGYLISDFDAVCVQGTCEYDFAIKYHNLPAYRIKKLGSPWARHIMELQHLVKIEGIPNKRKKIIGFAGVSNIYFPIESELLGLEILLEAINTGSIDEAEIVYRPFGDPEEISKKIEKRFSGISNLSVKFSKKANYGMDTYDDSINYEKDLEEYIQQISCYDLLIMVNFTSLCIDLAYVGVPTISYLFDPTGLLLKRKTEKMLNNNGREPNFTEIPVVHKRNQLIPAVKKLLNNNEEALKQAETTASRWDYKNADFNKILEQAIDA